MTTTNVRQLSKTSVFSTEILMKAPADLEVTDFSLKYRDLRQDLLNALTDRAWGVRINLSAETADELKKQARNLVQAGKTWEKSIKLRKTHGLFLVTRTKVLNDAKTEATVDLYFAQEPVSELLPADTLAKLTEITKPA